MQWFEEQFIYQKKCANLSKEYTEYSWSTERHKTLPEDTVLLPVFVQAFSILISQISIINKSLEMYSLAIIHLKVSSMIKLFRLLKKTVPIVIAQENNRYGLSWVVDFSNDLTLTHLIG